MKLMVNFDREGEREREGEEESETTTQKFLSTLLSPFSL
jgi:hypothetical protein